MLPVEAGRRVAGASGRAGIAVVDWLTGPAEASIADPDQINRHSVLPHDGFWRHIYRSPGWVGHDWLLGVDAGKHWRGFRRYRNVAAIRVPRGGRRGRPGPADHAYHRARGAVADPVGAADRRHRKIRAAAASRRQ